MFMNIYIYIICLPMYMFSYLCYKCSNEKKEMWFS